MKSERVLVSWVGGHDIKGRLNTGIARGPVFSTVREKPFDRVELLYNYPEDEVNPFIAWLREEIPIPVKSRYVELSSPIHFGEIYQASNEFLASLGSDRPEIELHILLSPGTPAMQAVWLLLAKTRYKATFWQSSIEGGVVEAHIPFEIAAEYVPAAEKLSNEKLSHLATGSVPSSAAFDDIVTQNPIVRELKERATALARMDVAVLIEGESGTGKELFARAIHNASSRANKSFVAVNCGAIPKGLVDSVLFGHKKGAFTGAISDSAGVFGDAHGGTIFLDEFGELELSVQIRLLRILEDGSYTRVGETKEKKADVRLIAATNRDLIKEVAAGNFREDLFFRVAVGVLSLPPLRDRHGDLSLLTKHLLLSIVKENPETADKVMSPEALNVILRQPWRGNVRELRSVLLRAIVWGKDKAISAADVENALFRKVSPEEDVLGRDLGNGIDLEDLVGEVYRHYIMRALNESGGNKTRAAELLGLASYQNLDTRIKKYNI